MTETGNTTTASGVEQLVSNYYNQKAQSRLVASFVFNQFPEKKKIGKNQGQTLVFHRFVNVAGSTTALTQGTTTAGNVQLSANTTSVALTQYGQFIAISGFAIDTTHTSDLMDAASDVLADAASDTVDRLDRDNLITNATSFFQSSSALTGGTSATITTADVLSTDGLRAIHRLLQKNNVKQFSDSKQYVYIAHPYQLYDLKSDDSVTGWTQVNMYTDKTPVLNNEIGTFMGFRIFSTTQVLSTAAVTSALSSSALAYQSFAFGQGAQTACDLESNGIQIIVHGPGKNGPADPYENVSTIAYKLTFGCMYQSAGESTTPRAYRHITSTTA